MTPGRRRDTFVVDIETIGAPWDEVDEVTRDYLLSRAVTEGEREAVPRRLGLHPGTGRVIVIGMMNLTNERSGGILVEGRPRSWSDGGPEGFKRFDGDEAAILAEFWKIVGGARRLVTFNGRAFDGPFLMIRSALLGIEPSVNLAGYRYAVSPHCDLAEILSFQGALRASFGLDYWCRRFGIESPKDGGLDGSRVQEYHEDGRLEEIVAYCARDVVATARLYEKLERTLIPLFER